VNGRRKAPHLGAGAGALVCAAFVLAALTAEALGSQYANSHVGSWALRAFPLSWPQPLRVVWWLVVAGAAFGFRVMLGRSGIRQSRPVVVVSVIPFVVFPAGIAVGADWATWH